MDFDERYSEFIWKWVGEPAEIKRYHAYSYHHIDFPEVMRPAAEVLVDDPRGYLKIAAAHERLLEAGWEGDGIITIGWLPPFLFLDGDTYGEVFWHVKQSNNGTSWILSGNPLPFPELIPEKGAERGAQA